MDLAFLLTVIFFAGKRKTLPCLHNESYRPHLVVKGDEEYIGVCFIEGDICGFDQTVSVSALPLYEGVGYDKLKPQTSFFIMEGAQMVGEGIVADVFHHVSGKKQRRKE